VIGYKILKGGSKMKKILISCFIALSLTSLADQTQQERKMTKMMLVSKTIVLRGNSAYVERIFWDGLDVQLKQIVVGLVHDYSQDENLVTTRQVRDSKTNELLGEWKLYTDHKIYK